MSFPLQRFLFMKHYIYLCMQKENVWHKIYSDLS